MVFQYRCSHPLRYHLLSLARRGDRNSLYLTAPTLQRQSRLCEHYCIVILTRSALIFRETSLGIGHPILWRCNVTILGILGKTVRKTFFWLFKMLPRHVTLSRPVPSIPDHRHWSNCSTAPITHL